MPATTTYLAAWVLPGDRPPIRHGVVTIQQGQIVSLDSYSANTHSANLIDLGETALIPGLVNAHTHLEFSDLQEPLGYPGIAFTDWIRDVVALRNKTAHQRRDKQTIIQQGLRESATAGVCAIGEIASAPVTAAQYDYQATEAADIAAIIFHEFLGRDVSQLSEKQIQLDEFLKLSFQPLQQAGISPHAPYSVHPQLLQSLCEQAIATKSPVAMHIAETEAERELLKTQTGPFVDLLIDLGVWDESSFHPRVSILEILQTLAPVPRSLIVHGNYLRADEIDFIASCRQRMSIVYCPRTHEYFQHAPYPLNQFLSAGIRVAVGTDSRASNPDLNLFSELKTIAQSFPHLDRQTLLSMGTLNGAIALGLEHQLGTITAGKRAAFSQIIASEKTPRSEPWDWLFSSTTTAQSVHTKN